MELDKVRMRLTVEIEYTAVAKHYYTGDTPVTLDSMAAIDEESFQDLYLIAEFFTEREKADDKITVKVVPITGG